MFTETDRYAPIYAVESAVGVILATGNLGKRLTGPSMPKNLYISRDGGNKWRSVKPGSWVYEIGDHGAIIVVAKKDEATDSLEFSSDEGLTWETVKLSNELIFVQNIIIEPNS
jgi:hypothetical protein